MWPFSTIAQAVSSQLLSIARIRIFLSSDDISAMLRQKVFNVNLWGVAFFGSLGWLSV